MILSNHKKLGYRLARACRNPPDWMDYTMSTFKFFQVLVLFLIVLWNNWKFIKSYLVSNEDIINKSPGWREILQSSMIDVIEKSHRIINFYAPTELENQPKTSKENLDLN